LSFLPLRLIGRARNTCGGDFTFEVGPSPEGRK
jgi:hypothetical protein